MIYDVRDIGSNYEENLQRWARALGQGEVKRKIFLTIYRSRKVRWTGPEIANATGLSQKVVATIGRQMSVKGLFGQIDGSRIVYEKIDEVHHAKNAILKAADSLKFRESLPTKRSKGKTQVTNVTKTSNRFTNVGVANVGRMTGRITGNSQHNELNESARELLAAFDTFKLGIEKDRSLSAEQREDALGATAELEAEVVKPEQSRSMSKVRNAVSALKSLAAGTQALHAIYEQIHPFIAAHFHLAS